MTKPKPADDLTRRNRRIGDIIRALVRCPLCGWQESVWNTIGTEWQPKVIAYRANTARLRCPKCDLRFSLAVKDLMESIDRRGGFAQRYALMVWDTAQPEDYRATGGEEDAPR